jgi:hypothetical protein
LLEQLTSLAGVDRIQEREFFQLHRKPGNSIEKRYPCPFIGDIAG